MKQYNPGDIVTIPSIEKLQYVGWFITKYDKLTHDDLSSYNYNMESDMMAWLGKRATIDQTEGDLRLSINGQNLGQLYSIKEDDKFAWCFHLFDWQLAGRCSGGSGGSCSSGHEEGITPIYGWMICKHCGENLREIR